MGVLFDYFSAESDEEAGAVIDRVGGPGTQTVVAPQPTDQKRRLFGRKHTISAPVFETDPNLVVYDTVSIKGIDPVVQLGTLEELLTERLYDEIAADPRSGHMLAMRDEGECLVLAVTASLTSALATASPEDLARVVTPWSNTEEFWGNADTAELLDFLGELAGLAQRATSHGLRLYCWVCV